MPYMLNGIVSVTRVEGIGFKSLKFHFQIKAHLFCPVVDKADIECLRADNLASSRSVGDPGVGVILLFLLPGCR
jgi:hypothetical protein